METRIQIIKLRETGKSLGQIGEIIGLSRQRVHQVLKEAGLTEAGDQKSESTYETKAQNGLRKKLREFVYSRDEFKCQYCGVKCVKGDPKLKPCVDHLVPVNLYGFGRLKNRGSHGVDNLITACCSCNSKKGINSVDKFTNMAVSIYKKKIIEDTKKSVFKMYQQGMSVREIAKVIGKSHTWVWESVKERQAKKEK